MTVTCQTQKIEVCDLQTQIYLALQDYFNAQITNGDGYITLAIDGQKFRLSLAEA